MSKSTGNANTRERHRLLAEAQLDAATPCRRNGHAADVAK
jgi:hypothetical protein